MKREKRQNPNNIMKTTGLVICVMLMMLIVWLPFQVRADEAHSHDSKTFTAWTETDRLPAEGGSYYLTANVKLGSAWEVHGTVNLCLNGHSITYWGSGISPVITVSSGSTLNLYDCQDHAGSITGGTAGGVHAAAGNFNMYGGSISNNTGGPGLYLTGTDESFRTAQLSAGSITGNTNEAGNGGGIYMDTNVWLSLGKGFSLSENKAKNGGGIYAGDMVLLSGSEYQILDNHASENGGGIYADLLGSVSVNGAMIAGNAADASGGGVYVAAGGSVQSEYATIQNNTAGRDGGGIYIHSSADNMGASRITGGAVRENMAGRDGGGVYYHLDEGTELLELQMSGAAVIDRNTAQGERNNLFLTEGSKLTTYSSMSADAQIGITMSTPGIFTRSYINNFNTQDPKTVFFSDKSGYEIRSTADGKEAQLNPGDFYCITVEDSEHGTVRADHYSAAEGETVTLSPKPDAGYWIDRWEVTGMGGDVEVTDNQFVMPAYDVTVTGFFSQDALIRVDRVSLDKEELTFREGDSEGYQLTATVLPENALNKNITWSTSDAEVATVSDDGMVTAVKEGSAVITVTTEDNQKTATCTVTVRPPLFKVTFTDGQGYILQEQDVERGSAATAPADPVKAGYSFVGWDTDFSNITADLTVNAIWKSDNAIEYIDAAGNPLYQNEYTFIDGNTESLTTGWYVVQESVVQRNKIVRVNGNVNLILCDGKEYSVPMGVRVEGGNSLTIWCQRGGSGKLTCGGSSQYNQPGIGANETHRYQGNITINGGWIEAKGSPGAAGIGGAETSYGATVTINGGNVRAIGSTSLNCDGIGTGRGGQTFSSTTITGGTVYAEGKNGGAGIGRSHTDPGNYSKLTISGGKVTAIGHGGAGIGGKQRNSGENVSCGIVEITGGIVTAQSLPYNGNRSNAIGKGNSPEPYEYSDGSLDLSADRRVKAGADDLSASYRSTEQRVDSAHKNAYAVIDTCTHDSKSFTITVDTHTWHCDHCEAAEEAEPHNFSEAGVCTVCGARIYTVSFDPADGSGSMASVSVVGGTKYVLPQCAFTAPAGKAFTGWDYTGASEQPVGKEITVTQDMVLRPHWSDLTWATLQTYINNAAPGSTITLDRDLTAASSDTALTIPLDSRITLDLNGHTLNRNLSSSKSGGSVLYIHPSQFTIKNGTLTGGFTTRGGGVLVNEYFNTAKSQSFNLININIIGNTATDEGGGIYSDWGYGSVTGGSITNNHAWHQGGGVKTTGNSWGLSITGTTISGNRAGIGGGIFAGGKTILTDTVITGNRCAGNKLYYTFYPASSGQDAIQWTRWVVFEGGGVFVDSFSALLIGGSTRITDNVSAYSGSDRANNLFLRDRRGKGDEQNIDIVTSVEDLSADARIGITLETKEPPPDKWTTFPVPVTRNLPGNGALSNFFADDSDYLLGLNSNGEVILGKTKWTVTLKPGEGGGQNQKETVLTNSQYIAPEKPNAFTAPTYKELDGWKVENSETFYRIGDKIIVNNDLTLVAQWATPWQRLQKQIDQAANNATIKLDRDYTAVTGDTSLVIPNGKTITVDLNGHTLDGKSLKPGVINVGTENGAGAALTIKDTGTGQSGKVTGGSDGVTVYQRAALTLASGSITGNSSYGVNIQSGTFTMTGGTISGQLVGVNDSGTFTMSGGTISDNTTGVTCNGSGTFTLSGGTISGNRSVGVNCVRNGTFTMSGGTIIDNASIGVDCNGNFTITGGTISGHPKGVTLGQNANMSVGGTSGIGKTLRITENETNVNLPAGKKINRKSSPTGVRIGITTDAVPSKDNPEQIITSGFEATDAFYVFISDDPAYEVIRSSNGKDAALAQAVAGADVEPARGLIYDASPQDLAIVGEVTGGTVLFATAAEGPFTGTIPTGTDAGRYNFWFKVKGDAQHRDSEVSGPLRVTIAKAVPDIGIVTADETVESLDPADAHLSRSKETILGTLALDERVLMVGTQTYHWTFMPEDTENYTTVKGTVEITASDRDWNAPTYTWAADNSSVTAARTAKNDETIVQTETVSTTSKVTKEPTCEETGETIYTAVFTKAWFETQSKTVATPAKDHNWGEATYAWATDNSSVTATRFCQNDSSHVETERVNTTANVTKEPTCTEEGLADYTASFGNPAFETQTKTGVTVKALGHKPASGFDTENYVAPTCTKAGSADRVTICERCREKLLKEHVLIEALGHDFHEIEGTAVSAICTEAGKEADQECSNCHSVITGAEIPALGHDWSEWTVTTPATETTEGEDRRDCRRCESYETRAIPETDHVHHVTKVDKKDATCTEPGNIEYFVCDQDADQENKPCGRFFVKAEDGTETIVCGGEDITAREIEQKDTVLAMIDHTWDEGVTTKEATCTEPGSMTYTCTVCGATKEEEIIKRDHEKINVKEVITEPTCTECGYHWEYEKCRICNYSTGGGLSEDPPLDHAYQDIEGTARTATCTKAGKKADQRCSRCDSEIEGAEIPALGHDYQDVVTEPTCTEQGYTTHTCSRCGDSNTDTYVEPLGHDYQIVTGSAKAATCKEAGKEADQECSRCHDQITGAAIPALGHTPAGDFVIDNVTEATCTEEGAYDRVTVCKRCGEEMARVHVTTPALGHDYQDVVTEPTCTEQGYTTHTCSRCGDSRVDTYVHALGHSWGAWVIITPATETAAGEEKRTCSRCGETETRVIPETDHEHHVRKVEAKEATCTEPGNIAYYVCDQAEDSCGRYFVAEAEGTVTIYENGNPIPAREVNIEDVITPPAEHSWNEGEITKEPGCTSYGVRTYTCTVCGATREEEIDWPGHKTETVAETIREATCEESGYHWEIIQCKVCKEIMYKRLVADRAKGHDWDEPAYTWSKDSHTVTARRVCKNDSSHIEEETSETTAEITKQATCEEKGETTYTAVFTKEAFAMQTRTVADIDALGHDWSEWEQTVAPTCTEAGAEEHVCSRCEKKETREIAALGHDWSEWEQTAAPTCAEAGAEEHVCSRCEKKETREIAALGHDFHEVEGTAVPATCTEAGREADQKCSRCGEEITGKETPALGHDFHEIEGTAIPATCTEAGREADQKCSRCDSEITGKEIPALGHDYHEIEGTAVPATCTEAGREADQKCSRCDSVIIGKEIPALGHDWDDPAYTWSEDSHTVTARIVCKHDSSHIEEEISETTAEVTKQATCEEKGKTTYTAIFTNDAFATQTRTVSDIDALGHDFHEVEGTAVPATCTEAGKEADQKCSRCGEEITGKEIPALGHDFHEVEGTAVPATCTEAGKEADQKCSRCGEEITGKEIPAPGHDWSPWTVTKEATADEEGEETRVCTRCGEAETRSIPKIDPGSIEYRSVAGDGAIWTKGSREGLTFTFKRSADDASTFGHFKGIQVDGNAVPEEFYEAVPGSVVVTLKPEYLETLSEGEHKLAALFEDGNAPTATFTVRAAGADNGSDSKTDPAASGKKAVPPHTYDNSHAGVFAGLLLISLAALPVILLRKRYGSER